MSEIDLSKLREQSVRDAALRLQLHSAWRRVPPAPLLANVFPDHEPHQLAEASAEAAALLQCAYSAGDEALTAKHSNYPEIIARLQAQHPGFTQESYLEVINYGCYLAK
jgi:hypothetical protein